MRIKRWVMDKVVDSEGGGMCVVRLLQARCLTGLGGLIGWVNSRPQHSQRRIRAALRPTGALHRATTGASTKPAPGFRGAECPEEQAGESQGAGTTTVICASSAGLQ